ncbi:MAG: hypothetical protein C5B55_08365 [Blastocatellia bacterium]|nr:MAG: hypothetical protein C5B55_08365 [Blastocatellia bacterium]
MSRELCSLVTRKKFIVYDLSAFISHFHLIIFTDKDDNRWLRKRIMINGGSTSKCNQGNTTHGSEWMVQVFSTTNARRSLRARERS